jgi:hypothetical protein
MWAVAHVIHLVAANSSRLDTPWNIATVGLAVGVLLRPANGRLLVAMLLAQICDYGAEMPGSPDHWALIALVNLAILVTMLARRSCGPHVLAEAFPAARAIVLTVYAFAALSKYNTHFLDPVTSCANAIAGRSTFGLTGPMQDTPAIPILIIALETSVPLLLALPVTRRHWVRVAMLFHFLLSASPSFSVVDFTSALFALFLLFLSEDEVRDLLSVIRTASAPLAVVRDAKRNPPLTGVVGFLAFGFAGYLSAPLANALVYLAAQIYLLAILVAAIRTWRGTKPRATIGGLAWFQVPVLALAIAWALSPYLGLRTTGVFTMFSGIRTEGAAPNHVFMPHLRLAHWQDELVTIDASNDPALASSTRFRLAVPLVALRAMAMDDPDLTVRGVLNGRAVTFGPRAGESRLEPLPYWEKKLLHFRPVPTGEAPFCSIS